MNAIFGIRAPFQGLNLLGHGTQGAALGCNSARRWRCNTHAYEEIV